MSLIDYQSHRNSVSYGFNKGWLRYPIGHEMPPMPDLKKVEQLIAIEHELECRQCGHVFYDSVKQCPKCLSPRVRAIHHKPKNT